MKRKGLLVGLLLTLALALAACGNSSIGPIIVPPMEDIDSVTIQDNVVITNLTDGEWTQTLLAGIEKAEPTDKESVQDAPEAENPIQIVFNLTDGSTSTMYCYEKDGGFYIEQPYEGIARTDKAFYDWLKDSL